MELLPASLITSYHPSSLMTMMFCALLFCVLITTKNQSAMKTFWPHSMIISLGKLRRDGGANIKNELRIQRRRQIRLVKVFQSIFMGSVSLEILSTLLVSFHQMIHMHQYPYYMLKCFCVWLYQTMHQMTQLPLVKWLFQYSMIQPHLVMNTPGLDIYSWMILTERPKF